MTYQTSHRKQFQSTLPRGSDLWVSSHLLLYPIFQSTLPRGSDAMADFSAKRRAISIHAPSRERPSSRKSTNGKQSFQSTLPRGSDGVYRPHDFDFADFISIHAPSRERRYIAFQPFDVLVISIHAPSRERRSFPILSSRFRRHFNPRSLAGATGKTRSMMWTGKISIHAPSRERRFKRGYSGLT